MDPDTCFVCLFEIVHHGLYMDGCGHSIHRDCFDRFLEMQELDCDDCANAQYLYSSGVHDSEHFEDPNGTDFVEYSKPYSESIQPCTYTYTHIDTDDSAMSLLILIKFPL